MNFRRRLKIRDDATFDLTPMVDITLLLLTFFVMGSQFQQAMRREMQLPRFPGEAPRADSPRSILIDLLSDGTLRAVDGRPVAVASFIDEVKREINATGGPGKNDVELTIRADRTTPSLHLNALARELSRAGLRSWRLATSGSTIDGLPTSTGGGAP
ncbi:MAG: biopolymer transporter ExbD [Phycisphaerales bacterium]|jgi:biopolymer transport protein ExbD|nr:biopolymer transporter ExbD [Phycisphaerales bacterium]